MKIPKTQSGIDKKLKGFVPKTKSEMEYWIRLNLASIQLDMDKLQPRCDHEFIKELLRRYALLKESWEKKLEVLASMTDEYVESKLNTK